MLFVDFWGCLVWSMVLLLGLTLVLLVLLGWCAGVLSSMFHPVEYQVEKISSSVTSQVSSLSIC